MDQTWLAISHEPIVVGDQPWKNQLKTMVDDNPIHGPTMVGD